jgi:hypothetical protein
MIALAANPVKSSMQDTVMKKKKKMKKMKTDTTMKKDTMKHQ